jgi:hypothetical protein
MKRDKNGCFIFHDFPDFKPNLSPRQIFQQGSFGGTYWRPIYSHVTKKHYKNQHQKYDSWWSGIKREWLITPWEEYDKTINKYGVKVGSTLEEWEQKHWIQPSHPYGWIQWYCDFFKGKRCADDERQVKRWIATAGPNSRFRLALIHQIKRKRAAFDDHRVSPRIRQTLQHWAYELKQRDIRQNAKTKKKYT